MFSETGCLSIGDSFWVKDGAMCPPFSALVHHLVQTRAGPVHAATVSVSSCVGYVDLEGLVCFVVFFSTLTCLSSLLLLTVSLPSVSQCFLRPEGRNLMR